LAEALRTDGNVEASSTAKEALAILDAKGDTVCATRARALL